MGGQLVAYYSRRGRNFVGGEIRDLAVGNTEIAAGMVQVLTQADIFRIEPVREYSSDYCRCIDQARQDLLRGVRLELKAWPEGWEAYDTVYLGYPNHWNTLPVAVFSFVEGLDWTGKTIRPFCVHEGGGMGRSVADLQKACPAARITVGLPIHGADIRRGLTALEGWLEEGTEQLVKEKWNRAARAQIRAEAP